MADIYEIFKFPDISEHVKDVCVNKIGVTFPPTLTDEEYNSLSEEEKEMRTRQNISIGIGQRLLVLRGRKDI